MSYVYVFFDVIRKRLYIGFTENIKRRIKEHNQNKNWTTRRYQNKKLIFVEMFANEKDARRREKYLKSTKGRNTLRIMLREALSDWNLV